MTLLQAKKNLVEKIKNVSRTPSLDAEVLLQNLLCKDKTFVLMNKDFELSEEQSAQLDEWTKKRASGLPVAYIIGKKEFYGYEFFVNESVLIPKPDTEILVEHAVDLILELLDQQKGIESRASSDNITSIQKSVPKPKDIEAAASNSNGFAMPKSVASPKGIAAAAPISVCDMCSGSGCVGISILRSLIDKGVPLHNIPQFTLVDISAAALEVSKKNAAKLLNGGEAQRINFIQSDLFSAVPQKFDLIVTNPPYIPHKQVVELLKDGRREPALALDGDAVEDGKQSTDAQDSEDGLAIIRRLALEAKAHLTQNGVLLMEAGEYNICAASEFLLANGFTNVEIYNDLEGQKRVVAAQTIKN